MLNKFKATDILFLLALNILVGTLVYANDTPIAEELKDVLIIGSAEHPDPVLERVKNLEKEGVLRNVIVMESFPVQIRVTGPSMVIEELQKMPRIISPSFK
ncbi:MAG: hypothetical protein COB30_003700 [Ectothiorhodospiraceae bacterium]|nr:hypothetical protein [Ectothiorhodospiraceae bacterium]